MYLVMKNEMIGGFTCLSRFAFLPPNTVYLGLLTAVNNSAHGRQQLCSRLSADKFTAVGTSKNLCLAVRTITTKITIGARQIEFLPRVHMYISRARMYI